MRTLACLTAIFALSATGCGTCDTGGQRAIEFNGGKNNVVEDEPLPDVLRYETSQPFAEYLHCPGGRRFDLVHNLGVAPYSVQGYLSFERVPGEGADNDNTGNFAEAAGNQFVIECIDDQRVRVRNDTCAETYLRVVLFADPGDESSRPEQPCRDVDAD